MQGENPEETRRSDDSGGKTSQSYPCLDALPLKPLALLVSNVDQDDTEIVTVTVDGGETMTSVMVTSSITVHYTFAEGVEYVEVISGVSNTYSDASTTNWSFDFTGNYTITGTSGVMIAAAEVVMQSNGVSLVDTFDATLNCPGSSPEFLSEKDFNAFTDLIGVP